MSFVRTESWIAHQPAAAFAPSAWLDQPWIVRTVAFTISLAVDAALIAALVALGVVQRPLTDPAQSSITTIDITSTSMEAQGAASHVALSSRSAPVPPSDVDATAGAPLPREWSVTTLPPLPKPEAPPAPPAAMQAANGLGATGSASGDGYDPYAFASYQKPDPARLAGTAIALAVTPDALVALEARLKQQLRGSSGPVVARLAVDPTGRISRADILSGATPSLATTMASAMSGFVICAPDPGRAADATVTVTLAV